MGYEDNPRFPSLSELRANLQRGKGFLGKLVIAHAFFAQSQERGGWDDSPSVAAWGFLISDFRGSSWAFAFWLLVKRLWISTILNLADGAPNAALAFAAQVVDTGLVLYAQPFNDRSTNITESLGCILNLLSFSAISLPVILGRDIPLPAFLGDFTEMALSTGATALAAIVSIAKPLTLCVKLMIKGGYSIASQFGCLQSCIFGLSSAAAVRSQSVIVGNLSDEVQNSIEDRYLPGDDEDDLGKKVFRTSDVEAACARNEEEETVKQDRNPPDFTSFNSSTDALLGHRGSHPSCGESKVEFATQTALLTRGISLRRSQTNETLHKDIRQLIADDQRGIFDQPTGKDVLEFEHQDGCVSAAGHGPSLAAASLVFDVVSSTPVQGDPQLEPAPFSNLVSATVADDDVTAEQQRLHQEEVLAGDMTPCFDRPTGKDLLERGLWLEDAAIDAHFIFHQALTSRPRAFDADILTCAEATAQEDSAASAKASMDAAVSSLAHFESLKTLEENALVSGSPFLRDR